MKKGWLKKYQAGGKKDETNTDVRYKAFSTVGNGIGAKTDEWSRHINYYSNSIPDTSYMYLSNFQTGPREAVTQSKFYNTSIDPATGNPINTTFNRGVISHMRSEEHTSELQSH